MKSTALLVLSTALIANVGRAGDDPFLGHWFFNAEKSKLGELVFRIEKNGLSRYQLTFTDGNKLTLPADGTTHPDPLGGTASLKQIDDHTLRLFRKRATERIMTITAAGDGKSVRTDQADTLATGDKRSSTAQWERIAPGEGLVGAWKLKSGDVKMPDTAREMDIEPFGKDGLSFLFPADKYRLDLRFDGKQYKDQGPNVANGSTNIGTRIDLKTIRVEGTLNGKPWDVTEYRLSPDDKTLTVTYKAGAKPGSPMTQVFERR